jgi:hypothetical protein
MKDRVKSKGTIEQVAGTFGLFVTRGTGGLLLLAWVEIGVLGVYANKRWPDLSEQSSDSNAIPTLPNSS